MNQGPLDKGKLIISVPAYWNFSILLSAMHVEPQLRAICKTSVDTGIPSSTLTAKGSSSINLVSIARNDSIRPMPGEVVHQECHHKYCNWHQTPTKRSHCQAHQAMAELYFGHLSWDFLSRLTASFVVEQPNLREKKAQCPWSENYWNKGHCFRNMPRMSW